MTEPVVHAETVDGICTVTLDDPDRKNALSAQLTAELMDALDAAEADDAVRVIVLTNTGDTFCAGANLNWMKQMATQTREENLEDARKLAGMFRAIDRSPQPVIGRVQGAAIGGGAGLVAACDIVVASTRASFAFSVLHLSTKSCQGAFSHDNSPRTFFQPLAFECLSRA